MIFMKAKPSLLILTIINIFILLSMLPQCMGSYSMFYGNETFRRFFHYTKISISALSNYFSAVEIYLTIVITAECYLRARSSSLAQVICAVFICNNLFLCLSLLQITPGGMSIHKRKITVFLPAISFCFALFHLLSFLPFLGDIFPSLYEKGFPIVISVMNSALITGKILILALVSRTCLELGKCGMFVTY
uniref:G_PROTEIN_RECEP_F1_2 domain-containing protein n=1 Tax=Heterorhabditis bacteriophora TaxID=37862 RepID=A0A1I7X332_HETBA